jgi:DNA-binding Lrp family transcriptional regulator
MDTTDRKIIDRLRADSSVTSAELGDAVGLSPSAAHRRVKLLEEAGLIRGYGARLSAAARGNPSVVFVAVTLKDQARDTLEHFEREVARRAEVAEAHLMSGEHDYLLKVEVREDDSYERVHREVLAGLPGVHRLVSHFSIRTVVEPLG